MSPVLAYILGILTVFFVFFLMILGKVIRQVAKDRKLAKDPGYINETMKIGENVVVKLGNANAIS